jgi:hypothetical protein
VIPDRQWGLNTPNQKAVQSTGSPSVSSQPLKSILKTPDRTQFSGGKTAQSAGHSKSSKKKKKNRTPKISWQPDIKREHVSY